MAIYAVVSIAPINQGTEDEYWKHRLILIEDRGPDVRGAVVEHLAAKADSKEDAEKAKEMTLEALKYLGIRVGESEDRKWDFRQASTVRVPLPVITEDRLAEALVVLGQQRLGPASSTRIVVCNERENLIARRIQYVPGEVAEGEEFPVALPDPNGIPIEVDPYADVAFLEAVI